MVGVDVGGAAAGGPARGAPAGSATAAARRPRPRSVSAWRSRNRRNPLSPALPTQSGQSCAQPSRSSGPRHDVRRPAPQAIERRAERHRLASLLRPDRRPRPERRDVDEAVGVEDLGQQLDAVDDARARAG